MADGFTCLAVVVGALGFPLADPIVGLLITVAILAVLFSAAREIYRRLMVPRLARRPSTRSRAARPRTT